MRTRRLHAGIFPSHSVQLSSSSSHSSCTSPYSQTSSRPKPASRGCHSAVPPPGPNQPVVQKLGFFNSCKKSGCTCPSKLSINKSSSWSPYFSFFLSTYSFQVLFSHAIVTSRSTQAFFCQ
eukprot:Lithocolla_globosa_v1_NODE_9843_length_662_cov_14.558484.p2 type:complete len:121 gc:universal NODE_9843_length_662_cov_14.558484:294-656(+)